MRVFLLAAALGVALLIDPRPAPAAVMPWCAVASIGYGDVYWDCRYPSFAACYPNILAGNRGFCIQNRAYPWDSAPAKKPRRYRHR